MPTTNGKCDKSSLAARGIVRGASVRWEGFQRDRYGCVMDTDDLNIARGRVCVQASNARLFLPAESLTPCPEVDDPVSRDHYETYH